VFDLADALQLLADTPEVLRAWLGATSPGWHDCRERPDSWSPRDVVAHLIHGEKTDWLPRVQSILEHGDELPFAPFDRAGHATDANRPLEDLLDEFAARRAHNLEELQELKLSPADLDRPGRHPELGTVSLRNLLAAWTAHDLDHLAQIARVMATRWRASLGPWDHPDYLGVLHRRLPR